MFGNKKLVLGLILGLVGAVAIFCITVGVGCAVNGLTFGEQVVEWFGNSAPVVEDAVEQVTEKVAETPIA